MVSSWCENRNLPLGSIVTLGQLWRLAETWYSKRLTQTWQRPTLDQAQKILADAGLTGPFWQLKPEGSNDSQA